MPDFDSEMMSGFAEARKEENKPNATADSSRVRKERIRGEAKAKPADPKSAAVIEKNSLQMRIDRLVRLFNEKAEVQDSIKAEWASAKEAGYGVKAMRIVVKRALESDEERVARQETELTAEQMMQLLGMLADTPLGEAAMRGHA